MQVHTLAHRILGTANLNLDGEIAAELLAIVVPDDLPNTYLNGPEFSGQTAIDSARTSAKRAIIVAANTTDVEVQRALFEMAQSSPDGDSILKAMLGRRTIADTTLLCQIHDYLWNSPIRSECRELTVRAAPAVHCAKFAARFPYGGALRYDYSGLASAIGCAAADGNPEALAYVDQIADCIGDRQQKREEFLANIGRSAAVRLKDTCGSDTINAFRAACCAENVKVLLNGFFQSAKLISADVFRALLEIAPTPDEFRNEQRRSIESSYTGKILQFPYVLHRLNPEYTDDALIMLARTFPGALEPLIDSMPSEHPQRDLAVSLALESNMFNNAVVLLTKRSYKPNSENKPLLRADQLHAAVNLYHHGLWIEKPSVSGRPALSAGAAAKALPEGAALEDVRSVMSLVDRPEVFVSHILDERYTEKVWYTPNAFEARTLLDDLGEVQRIDVVKAILHHWAYRNNPRRDRSEDPYEVRLDAVVDSIPACDLAKLNDGVRYIATLLSEHFPGDSGRWHHALGLICSARVGISKVISAAGRLG